MSLLIILVDSNLKSSFESLCSKHGISVNDAVTQFAEEVVRRGNLSVIGTSDKPKAKKSNRTSTSKSKSKNKGKGTSKSTEVPYYKLFAPDLDPNDPDFIYKALEALEDEDDDALDSEENFLKAWERGEAGPMM